MGLGVGILLRVHDVPEAERLERVAGSRVEFTHEFDPVK